MGRLRLLVYKAETPSGKVYIGITKFSLSYRKRKHNNSAKLGSNFPIHRAIRKYGDEVSRTVIAKTLSWDNLCKLEQKYIQRYDSFNNGLNCTAGGEGMFKRKHTEESKQKMRESSKGYKVSQELKARYSQMFKGSGNPFYGRKHTSTTKKRMSTLKEKAVIGTNLKTGEEIYLKSMSSDSRFSKQCISYCIKGKHKTHAGYSWRLA